ncbi:MAG TPA: IclR family transcriptional regulator [Nocardioides sp.]|uniref:IclR family transcriptional regulator n=1 Tax=Nocardioides sp. TaxID=35761 RepID=UPI002BFF6C20|nr:IclR family transcriptional regulator [Nocardioides sp.]HTW16800.1 IclR family transcriptional regulator [Nocardioides sp.]
MTLVQERVGTTEDLDGPRTSVVARVTRILDVFAQAPGHLLLEDVTAIAGLPRSTTFRIMAQLVEQGWLAHGSRGYRLGPRAQGIAASGEQDHGRLRQAAAGVLNDLQLATGSVIHLGVLEGGMLVYLDKLGGAALQTVPSQIGGRVPADTTPMGRAMLATLSPEHVDALLSATADLPRRRPLDLDDLHTRLHACRRRAGIDVVLQADRRNIAALGAPVSGENGLLASIGIASRGGRVVPEKMAPLLLSAARRLTHELGGAPRGVARRSATRRPA